MSRRASGPNWDRRSWTLAWALVLSALVAGCPTPVDPDPAEPTDPDPGPTASAPLGLTVRVTLDGDPAVGVTVGQAGLADRWVTDTSGSADVLIDRSLEAEHWVVASHPDARQSAAEVPEDAEDGAALSIELVRFDRSDNLDYTFRDPGEPTRRASTEQCAHCHVTINQAWFDSPHRTSSSNPVVHDVYAGARGAPDEGACESVGGAWRTGVLPGTNAPGERCYIGDGALATMNEQCVTGEPCEAIATEFGGCADCHAPGIDGELGGRDLLEATGLAFDYGVHCDVCHRTESVDLDAEPGVAGRLGLMRPSEPGAFGQEFQPMVFGPFDDVATPVMGAVARDLFHQALLCAGCHEQQQPVLVPGQAVDPTRWPDGRLPIHTTFSEWRDGPMNPAAPCHCADHMS